MGYTTDANYLIQGGVDIAAAAIAGEQITTDFESRSTLAWHEWGPFSAVGKSYGDVRQAMADCMNVTVATLAAYAQALQESGKTYLALEEANEEIMRRMRESIER